MNDIIQIFKALSDRNRIRIVYALIKHGELCACQITELIQVTSATASRHMSVLIASGLIESRKDGRWVYYRVFREETNLNTLIEWVESQLAMDAGIACDLKALEKITSIEPEILCRKQRGEKCC